MGQWIHCVAGLISDLDAKVFHVGLDQGAYGAATTKPTTLWSNSEEAWRNWLLHRCFSNQTSALTCKPALV